MYADAVGNCWHSPAYVMRGWDNESDCLHKAPVHTEAEWELFASQEHELREN